MSWENCTEQRADGSSVVTVAQPDGTALRTYYDADGNAIDEVVLEARAPGEPDPEAQ